MVADPFGSKAVASKTGRVLYASESLWPDHPCCGLIVKSALVRHHATAIQAFVTQLFENARMLSQASLQEIIETAGPFLGQDKETVEQALSASAISFAPEKLLPDRQKLAIIQSYMHDVMGVISRPVDPDSFINSEFSDQALSEISQ